MEVSCFSMKKFLALVALSLFLVGCVTSHRPPPPRPVVTGEIISYTTIESELRPLMDVSYDPQLILMDSRYGCIPEEAMRRILNEGLANFSWRYVEESADCDDGALDLTVILRHLFRRDTGNVPLAAPIGIIGGALVGNIPELNFVWPGVTLYHAVILVRCQGGKYLLVEPASKQICEFTSLVYEGNFEFFLGIF